MATHGKTAGRGKTAKPAKKTAAKSAKKAGAKSASARKPVAKKPAAKSSAARAKTAVRGAPAVKTKPAPAAKAASKKILPKARPAARRSVAPDPRVRPLGVLPPESRARTSDRPSPAPPPVAVRARPSAAARRAADPVRVQGAQRVTEKDLKEFEDRLMTERQRILKEMGHLESTVLKVNQRDSSGDLSGYSFHMADAGTDAIEREKAFMFASAEGRALLEINEALRRLYRGEYGLCESCGKPIARARLEAMPHARLCLSCKELEERASRGAQ
jgi:DnaK suppressor protein